MGVPTMDTPIIESPTLKTPIMGIFIEDISIISVCTIGNHTHYEQNPQNARRNNFPGEQISRQFLLLSENLSASNYPGSAYEYIYNGYVQIAHRAHYGCV
jgi:hypothetical protein